MIEMNERYIDQDQVKIDVDRIAQFLLRSVFADYPAQNADKYRRSEINIPDYRFGIKGGDSLITDLLQLLKLENKTHNQLYVTHCYEQVADRFKELADAAEQLTQPSATTSVHGLR